MSVIESTLDTRSERFVQNRTEMLETLGELDALHEEVAAGGGEDAMKRLRARGKMPLRERIAAAWAHLEALQVLGEQRPCSVCRLESTIGIKVARPSIGPASREASTLEHAVHPPSILRQLSCCSSSRRWERACVSLLKEHWSLSAAVSRPNDAIEADHRARLPGEGSARVAAGLMQLWLQSSMRGPDSDHSRTARSCRCRAVAGLHSYGGCKSGESRLPSLQTCRRPLTADRRQLSILVFGTHAPESLPLPRTSGSPAPGQARTSARIVPSSAPGLAAAPHPHNSARFSLRHSLLGPRWCSARRRSAT